MRPKRKTERPRRAHFEPKERLLAIRIPESLYARLDTFCDTMRVEVPWVRMTRSDAVRWLLTVQLRHDTRGGGSPLDGSPLDGPALGGPTIG